MKKYTEEKLHNILEFIYDCEDDEKLLPIANLYYKETEDIEDYIKPICEINDLDMTLLELINTLAMYSSELDQDYFKYDPFYDELTINRITSLIEDDTEDIYDFIIDLVLSGKAENWLLDIITETEETMKTYGGY